MKKFISLGLTGLLATATLCAAGCGSTKADKSGAKFSSADATCEVYTVNETADISDTLFGIFLEDINYSSYALDNNLLANNSFESTQNKSKTYGWTASGATLSVENTDGVLSQNAGYKDSGVNTNYAKLVVTQSGGGLSSKGYDAVPIALQKDVEYIFSAFVKAPESAVTMNVSVKSSSQTLLNEDISVSQDSNWIKYTRTIKATDTQTSGLTFSLTFDKATTVYLDNITLQTTDSTDGIQNYMYNAIKDLGAKFVRFPGGCIIEGNGAYNINGTNSLNDTAYDWKNSIGAAVTSSGTDALPAFEYQENTASGTSTVTTYGERSTRMPNQDLWSGSAYYDMEYGVGFYEYFLLCENIGASAVPVVNCGYSCQGGGASNPRALKGRHGNGIQDYIQDALDLVAFAKGDPNSSDANEAYWAKIRVNMGHPEPFDMTYLGIGNEQFGVYYNYYNQFVDAFKSAKQSNPSLYGDIQLIVGNGTSFTDIEKEGNGGTARSQALVYQSTGKITNLSEYGVHDHHYYMNYTDFFSNTTVYDSYSRDESTRYNVFVGEYSANDSTAQQNWGNNNYTYTQINNSWLTALSEAAYMTGLERNGDVVKLAAYAPMFAMLNSSSTVWNQWAADMMYYTNSQLVLTPNYYVQQIFMQNTGTNALESNFEYSSSYESTQTAFSSNEATSVTYNKLYQVASVDKTTGDIIVKIVNASSEDAKVNVRLYNSSKLTGIADVTELQNNDRNAVSSLSGDAVTPVKYTLSVSTTFGYTAQKYSVAVIRVHVK